jgi:hypothetical protein
LKEFFSFLVLSQRLSKLIGFENEEFLFPGIANVVRYCIFAVAGKTQASSPTLAFYIRNETQLRQEERFFTLSSEILRLVNPNTRTSLICRTKQDAAMTIKLYKRFPIMRDSFLGVNPWGISYLQIFNMASDSDLFLTKSTPDTLPLYEAKLFWHYDHRFGSYELKGVLKGKGGRGLPDMPLEKHQDSSYVITPQYWVERQYVDERLRRVWNRDWLLSFRTTSSAKLERTLVAAILPRVAVNHKAPIILLGTENISRIHLFLSCFNSLVFDYIARQKVGGTDVGFFHLDQLPCPTPNDYTSEHDKFIRPRVLELTFTAEDMRPFAEELAWLGNPFKWEPERRLAIQCELDAFYAHIYGLSRDEFLFIIDPHEIHGASYPGESFRVLKEKEESKYGEFRTKRLCLQFYDAMQQAIATGQPYQTLLDPPPANGWTPPEIRDEGGGMRDEEEVTTAPQAEAFQLQMQDARPQPTLFDLAE